MMDALYTADSALFVALNQTLANPVTDWFMPLITNDNFLRFGYAAVALALLIRGDTRLRWAVLSSVVVIALADQLSSGLLKPFFERARPCHDGVNFTGLRLLVSCGAGMSFPSSHAANSFAVCIFYPIVFADSPHHRRLLYSLGALATLISLSRVFVGVHYPADVLAGAALGAGCGAVVGVAFSALWNRYFPSSRECGASQ